MNYYLVTVTRVSRVDATFNDGATFRRMVRADSARDALKEMHRHVEKHYGEYFGFSTSETTSERAEVCVIEGLNI